jgi:VanZ family protein
MPALLLIACALLALVLFGRVPADALWANDLNNFAHAPVFAVLSLILLFYMRRHHTRRTGWLLEYAIAFGAVLLLGVAVEAVQSRIGRDAEFGDILRDALGALAALGFVATVDPKLRAVLPGRRRRIGGLLVGVVATALSLAPLAVGALAYLERERSFPVILDFDRPHSDYFVAARGGAETRRAALPRWLVGHAQETRALQVKSSGARWWGVKIREPISDWSGFGRMVITIANPNRKPLDLQFRIYDAHVSAETETRFATEFQIPPSSWATSTIPLAVLVKPDDTAAIDISDIRSLMLARSGGAGSVDFYIVRIWLE